MYVQLKKALYGTLQAALLFWKKMTKKLVYWGFKVNPYGASATKHSAGNNAQ
jgi:hypothetical protein